MGAGRSLTVSIALTLAFLPRLAFAAACVERAECPSYFECVEGACAEADIACQTPCPPHLTCQPTSTTPSPSGGEPAPSDFFCAWSGADCAATGQCAEHFECVPCEPPEKNFSCTRDRCMPSRLPCQVHADCPAFFYCNEFTADEIPSYWPPGAGRACKPLLGHGKYAPRELGGGTLIDEASASGGTSAAGGSSSTGGSNTGPSAEPTGKTEPIDERTSSCTCRTGPQRAQPAGLAVVAFALGVSALRRARKGRGPAT